MERITEAGPTAPRVAVIVPTRDAARTIEACLASARAQYDASGAPVPVELVVVDNGSTDGTPELAAALADRVIDAGPERSAQRNIGAAAATTADIVGFVDADQLIGATVVAEVTDLLDRAADVGPVVVPEVSAGQGFWASCRALERRLSQGDERTEAARFFPRRVFVDAGGFDEDLTGPEDWELHDRMVAAGWRVGRTRAQVVHDEGRLRLTTCFAKKRYYGRCVPSYRSLPWARRGAFDARRALPDRATVLHAPVRAGGLVVLKAVEGAGIVIGAASARHGGDAPTPPGPGALIGGGDSSPGPSSRSCARPTTLGDVTSS